jgi:uncharacterized protein
VSAESGSDRAPSPGRAPGPPRRRDVRRRRRRRQVPETLWTEFYLDIEQRKLTPKSAEDEQQESFEAMSDGLTFWTDSFDDDTELTGPAAASLTVSSTTTEADVFLTLRVTVVPRSF